MSAFGATEDEAGEIYPVVNGFLRRHPGLPDPIAMSGNYGCTGRIYPVLLVWLVEPEDGRSFRECGRCFQEGVDNCPGTCSLAPAPLIQSQMR